MYLAPASGAGAVGVKEAKESSDEHAFENVLARHALQKSAFSEVIQAKAYHSAQSNGYKSFPGMGSI